MVLMPPLNVNQGKKELVFEDAFRSLHPHGGVLSPAVPFDEHAPPES